MSQPPYDPYRGQRRARHEPADEWPSPGYQPMHSEPGAQPYQPMHGAPDPQHYPADRRQQGYPPEAGRPRPPGRPRPQGPPSAPPSLGRGFRLPGPGLLLTLLGLVVQLLSATLLPIARAGGQQGSLSLPSLWRDVAEQGTSGFGEWYVLVFSYPLFALGVLLALASVLESVAMKIVWGGLTLIALAALVLRYGLGPFTGMFDSATGGKEFTTPELVMVIVGVAALVGVIFVLRMAVSMFRRVAGLILLALSGVHVTAVLDLVQGADLTQLSFGAYGPALGYLLMAVAAFIGPRRIPGL